MKPGDRVTIKPDSNRKPAYCAHFGIGEVWKLTRTRVAVVFVVEHGKVMRRFKPEHLIPVEPQP